MSKKFYITEAIPYVNAKPHIGHALEFLQTNAIARYHRIKGEDVLTLCGGDENALKNVQAAEVSGEEIQKFVDKNTEYFHELTKLLNAEFDVWQKGSDQKHHFVSSQKLWDLCDKNGDIYKKKYKGLYCVGCEVFYTPDELNENGECFEHPGKKLTEVEEENYFFSLSKYTQKITEIIESGTLKIIPETRKNEMLSFLSRGLTDISISRSNERARNWGVPVPGDNSQRIYVWFDALNIYQSGIGFGWDDKNYQKYWPADVQVIGKGIIRFHAVYWIAFLLSAGLELPKSIFVHEYFTVNGQKMSKTIGNVYDPVPLAQSLIEKVGDHGIDVLRYFCLGKFSPFQDGDFSEERLYEVYKADLQNGLGNLVSRVSKMSEGFEFSKDTTEKFSTDVVTAMEKFEFDSALKSIWDQIKNCDTTINKEEIWAIKDNTKKKELLQNIINVIRQISYDLQPFLPETAKKVADIFSETKISSSSPLFPRLN